MGKNNEDDIKTDEIAPRFDLILMDVPPARRMRIVDILMKVKLGREPISIQEAMMLTFKLPSVLARSLRLDKAIELETVFDVYGAKVELRPTHKTRIGKKGDTKELPKIEVVDPDSKPKENEPKNDAVMDSEKKDDELNVNQKKSRKKKDTEKKD